MKKTLLDFVRRGLTACGFGPVILAVIYWILHSRGLIESLTVNEVCTGICSLFVLAFIAGGMNCIYQIEKLPLMVAISIHGGVLYGCYLLTYLLNGWLEWGTTPILVFSGIFALGYLVIWAIIYSIIKRNTNKINELLKKQQSATNR